MKLRHILDPRRLRGKPAGNTDGAVSTKKINLALQGGGAHGAFTWGVIDHLGKPLSADSKLSTDYDFFELLRDTGRRAARRFLDDHFDDIGIRSTVDLRDDAHAEWA